MSVIWSYFFPLIYHRSTCAICITVKFTHPSLPSWRCQFYVTGGIRLSKSVDKNEQTGWIQEYEVIKADSMIKGLTRRQSRHPFIGIEEKISDLPLHLVFPNHKNFLAKYFQPDPHPIRPDHILSRPWKPSCRQRPQKRQNPADYSFNGIVR